MRTTGFSAFMARFPTFYIPPAGHFVPSFHFLKRRILSTTAVEDIGAAETVGVEAGVDVQAPTTMVKAATSPITRQ